MHSMDSHGNIAAFQALDEDQTTSINNNDSYPSVSSELLIEDEEANQMVMPNFAYIYACSSTM